MTQFDHDQPGARGTAANVPSQGSEKGKKNLLFIDDDPSVVATLKMLFGRDFNTFNAANAEEGIQLFKELHPDVVILDLRLPGKDGIATLKALRTLDQATPVVIVTGYATQATAEESLRLGASDYVHKPFDAIYLRNRVSELAYQHRKTPDPEPLHTFAESLRRLSELELTENASSSFLHDVANPLTGLITMSEMLRASSKNQESISPERFQESLQIISDNARYMAALVEHWRAFSEPQTLRLEKVPLGEVLNLTVGLVQGLAADRNVRLEVEPMSTGPELKINRYALARVLANLVQNAIEAVTPGSGVVKITTSRDADAIKIIVSDNGPGIPLSFAKEVFEPRMTTKSRSMGLGLYISKKIVHSNGGDISFRNLPLGGAEFTLTMEIIPS